MTHLVSILIPVFNRAHLIEETVRSALAQTYAAIEVIVVDNASTDQTWLILERLAADDRRLKIFRNETNIGPVRNWRACLERASGYFSKILWSDDLINREYIERCLPYLDDLSVGFVYSAARIFDDRAAADTGPVFYDSIESGVHDSRLFVKMTYLGGDVPVSPGCAVFRTQDLRKNLLIDVPNSFGSDFSQHAIGNDLLIFLLTAGDYRSFAVVAEPLSQFRSHKGSISVFEGAGRVIAHYDIVKVYFAMGRLAFDDLNVLLNTSLRLHLLLYRDFPYGIRRVTDFYGVDAPRSIDVWLLMRLLMKEFFGRIGGGVGRAVRRFTALGA